MQQVPSQGGCPVCRSEQLRTFFRQAAVPTQAGYLASNRREAVQCVVGDINLVHCRTCGHVWNSSFDPDQLGFDPNYDFSQYHSALYREYVMGSIERLKTRYGLVGKTALDIGCGKGDYLRLLIQAGMKEAVGFDPTFDQANLSEADRRHITVHLRFYGREERGLQPDLVACRSVLQYIPAPRDFLATIRATLNEKSKAVVYFEVPHGAEAFRERNVWYVMYEAGCFFSAASLARLFRDCDFDVLDVLPALGSSQLEIEARPGAAGVASRWESAEALAEIERQIDEFSAAFKGAVQQWSDRFQVYRREGKSVVLWAAGMRAISFLVNVPIAAEVVEVVVDVNPQRQGRFLPKTGQEVIAPEALLKIKPDVVIATNPNYALEIRKQIQQLGLACEFNVLH